jgi:hypothetical protein
MIMVGSIRFSTGERALWHDICACTCACAPTPTHTHTRTCTCTCTCTNFELGAPQSCAPCPAIVRGRRAERQRVERPSFL